MFPILPNLFLNSNSDVSVQSASFRDKDKKTSANVKLKVESLLPCSSSNSDRHVHKSGVFAGAAIQSGTVSCAVQTKDLLVHVPEGRICVKQSSAGFLKSTQKSTSSSWLRTIKLSPDIHSYNALLGLTPDKNLRLRICKEIAPSEEIICWFTEEVTALMAIPFLTPANIRGNNCYTCHICNVSFETPNPLKIHLALSCAQQSIDVLWLRLHCAVHGTNPNNRSFEESHGHHQDSRLKPLGHNYRHSAFKPITSSYYVPSIPSIVQQVSTSTSISAAAQIETLVSNMGASKQGHLCIYCGKIYSRKYGLKIHIRTHTGFKPLKCKYCLRPFGDPSNLNKHVRLHTQTGSSVFKCHLCHKILARRRDLQRHMQTRHSENPEFKEKTSSSEDD